MALTDHCDIFAAFHEDGFNRILEHVQQQRPSLFNYGTAFIANNPSLLCRVIKAHPIIGKRHNPILTLTDPLPVPGSNFGVNFAIQISKVAVDFHPPNSIGLPPEPGPHPQQRFAMQLTVCVGFGCPPKEIVERYIPAPAPPTKKRGDKENERPPDKPEIIPLPTRQLICFCLDAFAVGGIRIHEFNGKPYLEPFLDGFEIVDIKPEGLENSLECYVQLLLRLVVLPQLRILLEQAPLELMKNVLSVRIKPMPTSAALPNNPAIEQDQLKAFIKVEVV